METDFTIRMTVDGLFVSFTSPVVRKILHLFEKKQEQRCEKGETASSVDVFSFTTLLHVKRLFYRAKINCSAGSRSLDGNAEVHFIFPPFFSSVRP